MQIVEEQVRLRRLLQRRPHPQQLQGTGQVQLLAVRSPYRHSLGVVPVERGQMGVHKVEQHLGPPAAVHVVRVALVVAAQRVPGPAAEALDDVSTAPLLPVAQLVQVGQLGAGAQRKRPVRGVQEACNGY